MASDKLTRAQRELLAEAISRGSVYVTEGWPPIKRLLALGYVETKVGKFFDYYVPTEAGRAALAALAAEPVAASPLGLGMQECGCDDPLIRCDNTGCRCQICGLPERLLSPSPAPEPGDRPYRPAVIDYPDSGISEFILFDTVGVHQPQPGGYDLLLDMGTRTPIGFSWPTKRPPAALLSPSPEPVAASPLLREGLKRVYQTIKPAADSNIFVSEACRLITALLSPSPAPEPTPTVSTCPLTGAESASSVSEPDYTTMEPSAMLEACRDDASKWAAAFCQTARKLGHGGIDQGWMIGWFANAIEFSSMVRSKIEAEPFTSPPAGSIPEGMVLIERKVLEHVGCYQPWMDDCRPEWLCSVQSRRITYADQRAIHDALSPSHRAPGENSSSGEEA